MLDEPNQNNPTESKPLDIPKSSSLTKEQKAMKDFERMAEAIITPDFIDDLRLLGFGLIGIGIILEVFKFPVLNWLTIVTGVILLSLVYYVKKNFKVVEA